MTAFFSARNSCASCTCLASAGSSNESEATARPLPAYFSCSATTWGKFFLQGSHQVALRGGGGRRLRRGRCRGGGLGGDVLEGCPRRRAGWGRGGRRGCGGARTRRGGRGRVVGGIAAARGGEREDEQGVPGGAER